MRGPNRNAARRDANEATIVEALRQAGAQVVQLDKPLDLLVGWKNYWLLMEVKNPKGRRKLTDDQVRFVAEAQGPVAIVESVTAALAALRKLIGE